MTNGWKFFYTNTDEYWPQFMRTGKPAYDGFYQYENVSTTNIRKSAVNINDWYNSTLPAECEYVYMNNLTTGYPMFGKRTNAYTKQGKIVNEMNTILGNTGGYSNTVFVDGDVCRVGYRTTRSNLTGETSFTYATVAQDGTSVTQTVKRTYDSCPNYLSGSTYYIFFEFFNFPTSEIDDWYIMCSGSTTVYIAKDSWSASNVSTLTWPAKSSSVTFMEMLPPKSQITLDNVNQLLPSIIAIGVNGETIGDGSIYNNLDKDTVIKEILNLTQTGTTGSYPLYCPVPTVYDATGGAEGELVFIKPNQNNYDFVLHENNITSGSVRLLYTSINTTIYDTNRDMIITKQTNRVDNDGTISYEYHLVYQQISTGEIIYDTIMDRAYGIEDADDYVLLTYNQIDYTNNLVLFYIKAYSKALTDGAPTTIRNILSSSVSRNSNYEYCTQAYYWDGVVVYNNSYRDKPNKRIYHRVYMYKLSTGSSYTIRNTSSTGYSTRDDYYSNVAIVLSCFKGMHNFYLTCTYGTGSYYASGTCYRINTTDFTCTSVGSASGKILNSSSRKFVNSNLLYGTDYTILLSSDYRTKISDISNSGQIHYTIVDQDGVVYIDNEFAGGLYILQDLDTSDNYLVSYQDKKLYKIVNINWTAQSTVTFTVDKSKLYDFGSSNEYISVTGKDYISLSFTSNTDKNYITVGTDNCVTLHIVDPISSGETTYWTNVKFIPVKITDSTDFECALIRRGHNYFVLDKHTSAITTVPEEINSEEG